MFDPAKIARYDEKQITALISNPSLVRNRLKIRSTASKVRAFLRCEKNLQAFLTTSGTLSMAPHPKPLAEPCRSTCEYSSL